MQIKELNNILRFSIKKEERIYVVKKQISFFGFSLSQNLAMLFFCKEDVR